MRPHLLKLSIRSIIVEVLLHWLVVMTLLLVIMFATQLGRYLGQAAEGSIPTEIVLSAFGLRSIHYIALLFAPALFFSVLMALGRLYRDNEMAAWFACGMQPRHVIWPVLIIALALSCIAGIVSLYLDPVAQAARIEMETKAKAQAKFGLLEPGQFRVIDDGRAVVYVGDVGDNGTAISNVFLHASLPREQAFVNDQIKPAFTLSASSGIQRENPATGERELVLNDGRRLEGVPGTGTWQMIDFAKHGLRFAIDDNSATRKKKRNATPTIELIRTGYQNKDIKNLVEFFTRLSVPLSMPLLALLAIPLARSGPRESRYGRLIVGVLSYVAFYQLQSAGLNWTEDGVVPPWLGPWWVHVLLLMFIVFQFWQQFGTRKVKKHNNITGNPGSPSNPGNPSNMVTS